MTMIERTPAERAGIPADLWAEWQRAVATRDYDDQPGKLGDILADLYNWLVQTRPVSIHDLTAAEALEERREIDNMHDFASDVESELYRVRVLRVGADRTAEETLADLCRAEREAEQWAAVSS